MEDYRYFKLVETEEEMNIFKKIWLDVCEEMNFESEDFHTKETGMHYLILNKEGDAVGTIEVGKYLNNEKSTVQYYYDYSQLDIIDQNMKDTYEIDKLCILPGYRSSGLTLNIIYTLIFHHLITGSKYYLSATEYKFYKALRIFFKVPMLEVTKRQKFNDFYLQPMLVKMEEYFNNLEIENQESIDFDYVKQLAIEFKGKKLHEKTI